MTIALINSYKNETAAIPLIVSDGMSLNAGDYAVGISITDGGGDTFTLGTPLSLVSTFTSTADAQTTCTASGLVASGPITSIEMSGSPNAAIAILMAFSGVDTTTPYDTAPVSSGNSAAGTSAQLTITTVTPNAMIVFPIGWDEQGTNDITTTVDDGGKGLSWTVRAVDEAGSFKHGAIVCALAPTPDTYIITLNQTNAGSSNAGWGGSIFALRPAVSGPSISAQPQSVTVLQGATANFSITASGTGTLHYQWKKNGVNVGTDSSSYALTNAQMSDNGASITCDVTDDNGSASSEAAILTVIPTGVVAWWRA